MQFLEFCQDREHIDSNALESFYARLNFANLLDGHDSEFDSKTLQELKVCRTSSELRDLLASGDDQPKCLEDICELVRILMSELIASVGCSRKVTGFVDEYIVACSEGDYISKPPMDSFRSFDGFDRTDIPFADMKRMIKELGVTEANLDRGLISQMNEVINERALAEVKACLDDLTAGSNQAELEGVLNDLEVMLSASKFVGAKLCYFVIDEILNLIRDEFERTETRFLKHGLDLIGKISEALKSSCSELVFLESEDDVKNLYNWFYERKVS